MKIRHARLLVLAAVSASFTLLWALPASAHPAAKTGSTITVIGKEFSFTLSAKSVKHGTVTFKFENKGVLPHDLKFCTSNKGTITPNACAGKGTPQIAAGKTVLLTIKFPKAGKYEYICTVPAHAQNGMKGVLTVT